MIELLREVQVPFLALLLLAAGAAKALPGRDRPGQVTSRYHGSAFAWTTAVVEVTLGTLLLTTPLLVVRLAATVFFATAASVVADLVRRGSDEACGCFGRLSTGRAGRLGVLRAALLTGAAIVSAGVPKTGIEVLGAARGWSVALLAADVVVFLALSPEVLTAVHRARHPVPCELRDVPLETTYATLRSSGAWREHAASLTAAEPTDVWRELCHRYLVYPAERDGRPVELVFAVPVDRGSAAVRAGVAWDPGWERQDDDSGPQRVHSPV